MGGACGNSEEGEEGECGNASHIRCKGGPFICL